MVSKKKQNWVVAISVIIGLVAMYFIIRELSWEAIKNTLKNATWELILAFVVIQIFMFIFLTLRWQVVLHSQGVKHVKFWHLFNYKMVGYSISFLTPSAKIGGEPVRAGLLSTREKMKYSDALSSVVIDKTIELSTSGIFTVIGFMIILVSFAVSEYMKYAEERSLQGS